MLDSGSSGLRAWWWQRVSAIYIGLFLLLFLGWLAFYPPTDYGQWRAWLGLAAVRIGFLVFFIAVGLHAYIGLRDIVLDYIPLQKGQIAVMAVLILILVAFTAWGMIWITTL